ncbi:MAG: hypothetical protein JKY09_07170 [Crocinitomicaceae bacterium]|nr:hypothetical protein [Crocinitomicaceae bacterium]
MDYDVELRFQKVKQNIEVEFGGGMDVQAILFLIGVNELGMGHQDFSKSEKTDLLHIAICTLLSPYKYYEFEGRDKDNWPHFKLLKELPSLNHREQQHLMKEAIIDYFEENGYFNVNSSAS